MTNRNGTWKVIAKILAGCLILFIGWFGNEVWSKQQTQDVSIMTLQAKIVATDKTVQRIEQFLIEDRACRKKQDSILQDVAIKVNMMFDGR